MKINRFIDYLVYPKDKLNPDDYNKGKFFVISLLFIVVLFAIGLPFLFTDPSMTPSIFWSNLVFFFGIVAILPLYKKYGMRVMMVNIITLISFVTCIGIYQGGGIFSSDVIWILIICLWIFLVANKKSGIIWFCVSLLIFIFFIYADINKFDDFRALSLKVPSYYYFINYFTGTIFIAIIILLHENMKEKYLKYLKESKEIIEIKNIEIQAKNKDITDSINYAKRLQDAILPPINLIKQYLPNVFVLYLPKDIVAGDFYWMEVKNNTVYIAAADCTGHGVPGAMVSVVCSNALYRAVNEFDLTDTGIILDKVTDLVLDTFDKNSSDIKDGMDISIIAINKATNKIQWSGANNPLWYFEEDELKEIKPDKQPVGKSDTRKQFTTQYLEYKSNTIYYLLTDGFPDQFGGEKGKKYLYKRLKDNLTYIHSLPMKEQEEILNKEFYNWKGDIEQIDDVTIIGIRLD